MLLNIRGATDISRYIGPDILASTNDIVLGRRGADIAQYMPNNQYYPEIFISICILSPACTRHPKRMGEAWVTAGWVAGGMA